MSVPVDGRRQPKGCGRGACVCGLAAGLALLLVAVTPPGRSGGSGTGAGPGPRAAAELKIGLAKPMFKDVPPAIVNAAAKPFQTMIQDKAGVKGSVEVVDRLHRPRRQDEGREARHRGLPRLRVRLGQGHARTRPDRASPCPNCGKVQACLVVNANSKAEGAEGPEGRVRRSSRRGRRPTATCSSTTCGRSARPGDCCPAKARPD